MNAPRRVVVTGLGWVTPLGRALDRTWERLCAGEVAVQAPDPAGLGAHAPPTGAVGALPPRLREALAGAYPETQDTRTQAGLAAAEDALRHAGLVPGVHPRIGAVLGSGPGFHDFAGLAGAEAPDAPDVGPLRAEAPAVAVATRFGLQGPVHAVTSACAAANQALGTAYRMVRRGEADAVVAGGADSMLSLQGLVFFVLLGASAAVDPDHPQRACRPFDRKRSGLVIGEGAGCAVLECAEHAAARGAQVLGELVGYGASLDAFRITAPPRDGEGAARAMRSALSDQGTPAGSVHFANAHGTGTKRNDPAEVAALHSVFGEHATRMAVSSGKGAMGHLLSGAAGVAFVACVLALRDQRVPPTANLQTPDRACDLDHVPSIGRRQRVDVALNNAFAFGGQNACVLVRRPDPAGGDA